MHGNADVSRMATISRLMTLLALVMLVAIAPLSARAQDTITLVPLTSEEFGLESVIPAGWTDLGNGIYSRHESDTDPTLIVQQSAPMARNELLDTIMLQLGMTEPPASSGDHQGRAFTWELYEVEVMGIAVDFALADRDGITYVVLLQSAPDERDKLRQQVYMPVLDALAPFVAEAEPVPYIAEDVSFENGAVKLAGTLTLPPSPGPHPAVVLVSGSGPQDRDETLLPGLAMKPFKLLSDELTRAGVAVLRYDDRGHAESTGDFDTATLNDFASDAAAAMAYLASRPEIDGDRIGLVGHSEGGLVAAKLAPEDPNIDFVVSLAGPGVNGADVLRVQNRRLLEAEGATEEEIEAQLAFVEELIALGKDGAAVEELIYQRALEQIEALPQEQRDAIQDIDEYARTVAAQATGQVTGPGLQSFLEYDPSADWRRTTIPVLAIFGERDVQVDAAQNAPAVEAALREAGNERFEVVVLPDANHLFQSAVTGAISEYAVLPAEFTADLMPTILTWLEREGFVTGLATPVAAMATPVASPVAP